MNVYASQSPEDELKKKQEDLKNAQDDVTALQNEIKALQAKIAEFQQATTGYDKFYETATRQFQDAKIKIKEKTAMAKSVITEALAQDIDTKIQSTIKDFNELLDKQKKEVDSAHISLRTAKTELFAADDVSLYQQALYEVVKKQPKDTDASIKEIQNLIVLAEKAHDSDDHVQMYLLAQIAEKALADNITILKLEDYKKNLMGAKDTAEKKKLEAATKKSEVDQKTATLSELRKNYASAVADSRSNLVKTLKEIKPTTVT